jgi:hypothetical protein
MFATHSQVRFDLMSIDSLTVWFTHISSGILPNAIDLDSVRGHTGVTDDGVVHDQVLHLGAFLNVSEFSKGHSS